MSVDFEIHPNPQPVSDVERAALLSDPGFGRVFTDHMVTVRYADGKGWYDARVEPRAPIPMDPATAVLSISLLLAHLGHPEPARRVTEAVAAELAGRNPGAPLRTAEIGDRLAQLAG